MVIGLVFSFHYLVRYMSRYHDKRYKEVKNQLVFFFVFETIPNAVFILFDFAGYMFIYKVISLETFKVINLIDQVIDDLYPLL